MSKMKTDYGLSNFNDIVLKNNETLSRELERVNKEHEEDIKKKDAIIKELLLKYLSAKEDNQRIRDSVKIYTSELLSNCGIVAFNPLIINNIEDLFDEPNSAPEKPADFCLAEFEKHSLDEWVNEVLKK